MYGTKRVEPCDHMQPFQGYHSLRVLSQWLSIQLIAFTAFCIGKIETHQLLIKHRILYTYGTANLKAMF